ncbi:3-hydroxyacyl-ACP dehydratase FabZ [Buchnera aphidicola (Kurisakia onigurumii)]|uniref:3-hydroxyacyl-ACP dehydratase FabZ n=1 Tax=Buchnera aphidicola TaxID=9 RepID=UPI0031B729B2
MLINEKKILKKNEVLNLLPHKYPFLLVDKIIEYKNNNFIKTIKNITLNDFFFEGHFPSYPIFPGVLIIESMAQSSTLLLYKNNPYWVKKKFFPLIKINNASFKFPVYPGDQIIIDIFLQKTFKKLTQFNCIARVLSKTVVIATISCIQTKI